MNVKFLLGLVAMLSLVLVVALGPPGFFAFAEETTAKVSAMAITPTALDEVVDDHATVIAQRAEESVAALGLSQFATSNSKQIKADEKLRAGATALAVYYQNSGPADNSYTEVMTAPPGTSSVVSLATYQADRASTSAFGRRVTARALAA